jgi:hypothetical protein
MTEKANVFMLYRKNYREIIVYVVPKICLKGQRQNIGKNNATKLLSENYESTPKNRQL